MMSWKTIFRSLKNKDMQRRLFIVIGLIAAYRLLAHIPAPLAEPTKMKEALGSIIGQSDLGGFLDLLSGGAVANFSLVLVGLSPFITASIITQLLWNTKMSVGTVSRLNGKVYEQTKVWRNRSL